MGNSVRKHINLVGGGSAVAAAPSRKRKMISKSKSRKSDAAGTKRGRGTARSSR